MLHGFYLKVKKYFCFQAGVLSGKRVLYCMKCSMCQQDKKEVEFSFRNLKTQTRYLHCKACQKILRQTSYHKNRTYFLNYEKIHSPIRRKKRRQFIADFKTNKPCSDCKVIYPFYVMDFDHLPQFKKEIRIGESGFLRSEEALLKEFQKCELVCANCHRIRTWNRKMAEE